MKLFAHSNRTSKGGFDAVYRLTDREARHFSRAWGPDYSWNVYQWYKGLIGQYVYDPRPYVPWAQRVTELKRLGAITGLVAGSSAVGIGVADHRRIRRLGPGLL